MIKLTKPLKNLTRILLTIESNENIAEDLDSNQDSDKDGATGYEPDNWISDNILLFLAAIVLFALIVITRKIEVKVEVENEVKVEVENEVKVEVENEVKVEVPMHNMNVNPSNTEEEFALWCIQTIEREGERKIGDNSKLEPSKPHQEWIHSKSEDYKLSLEISFGLNYPGNLKSKNKRKTAIKKVDKFLYELAKIGGRYIDGIGMFSVPIESKSGKAKEVQVETCGTVFSKIHPEELCKFLGLIRTAIWDYCHDLKQIAYVCQYRQNSKES